MRNLAVTALLLTCCSGNRSYVRVDDVALGRVVVYRNGVAYFERHAAVARGQRELRIEVPGDKVDDFLKSLTVVDRVTGKPLAVSFPHPEQASRGTVDMTIGIPDVGPADLLLTYITESPSWKPSYRVEVQDKGKVLLDGWAIVDNTSGEDWKDVRLGVGSSSAMSFRYDLWSIHTVERKTLSAEERFGLAPPMGGSPYAQQPAQKVVMTTITDESLKNIPPPARTVAPVTPTPVTPKDGLGALQGVVTDETTGQPMLLVTVVAAAPGGETRSALTDEDGRWVLDLPPGSYALTFVYGDSKARRENVQVARGGSAFLPVKLNAQAAAELIVVTRDRVPNIDTQSTKQGVTINPSPSPPSPSPSEPRAEPAPPPGPDPREQARQRVHALAADVRKSARVIVIEGFADEGETDPTGRSAARAHTLRNSLIEEGVPPAQLRAEARGRVAGQPAGVRLVVTDEELPGAGPTAGVEPDAPVGESHFGSTTPVTVPRASSIMLSTIRAATDGEIVYLYDPESARGNRRFAFRAVRFVNPTESTLDTGPLTVFGDGRFIGEGLAEPISAHAVAVVPFALDRQIVVERNEGSEDRIAALMKLERGLLTTEMRHVKKIRLVLTNRMARAATVYLRHTVQPGWQLVRSPDAGERLGDAHLWKVALDGGQSRTVELEESTPLQKTLDLRSPAGLDAVRVYAASPEADPKLVEKLEALLALQRELADGAQKLASLRARLADLRTRMDELHAQLLSLEAVRTKGKLMDHLQTKLRDVSDRVHEAMLQEIDLRDRVGLAQVRFQDGIAELSL